MPTPDSTNKFMVSVKADEIVILRPPTKPILSRADALNLAAWIVAVADEGDFDALLKTIRG